jgi:hypothetical protein
MDFNKDHSGLWRGEVVFGKKYGSKEGTRLLFDLELVQYMNQITGVAKDTAGEHVSPDEASINGTISDGEISFVKQYVHSHYLEADGSLHIDETKPGHLIYYNGHYREESNSFAGTWRIKGKFKLFGIIPISYNGGDGTWEMERL